MLDHARRFRRHIGSDADVRAGFPRRGRSQRIIGLHNVYFSEWNTSVPAIPYQAERRRGDDSIAYSQNVPNGGYHSFTNSVNVPRNTSMYTTDPQQRYTNWADAHWSTSGC